MQSIKSVVNSGDQPGGCLKVQARPYVCDATSAFSAARAAQSGQEQQEIPKHECHGWQYTETRCAGAYTCSAGRQLPNETEAGDQAADSTQTTEPSGATVRDKKLGESRKEQGDANSPCDLIDQKEET
jgi:hypothetical protein